MQAGGHEDEPECREHHERIGQRAGQDAPRPAAPPAGPRKGRGANAAAPEQHEEDADHHGVSLCQALSAPCARPSAPSTAPCARPSAPSTTPLASACPPSTAKPLI